MSKRIKSYSLRIVVSILIWLFFKITSANELEEMYTFDRSSLVYLITTMVIILTTWEVNNQIYNYFKKKYQDSFLQKGPILKYSSSAFIALFLIVIPSVAIIEFKIESWMDCYDPRSEMTEFIHTSIVSVFIIFIFIGATITKHFYDRTKQNELIKEQIEKENLHFKYESLRNQINPHFLFNSFSVLTSLVYKNPDSASEFINQLSKIYRYVIENKEKDLSALAEEITFLDSYMYLLAIRHDKGIVLKKHLDKNIKSYYIPSLSLQMLAENAAKHNRITSTNPLILEVSIKDDMLIVKNNLNKRKQSEYSSTGIGLKNIINRYELSNYPTPIIQEDEHYFIVKLPLIQK